ncbi:MAG: hypothetical protein PUF77_06160 [Clostridiales bacterium]|nr:hypothetical protein [Clostridiales bacterium]
MIYEDKVESLLYRELSALEAEGVILKVDKRRMSPCQIIRELCLDEDAQYMRDYCFDENGMAELHFDRIS